jgi:hypothetical protein
MPVDINLQQVVDFLNFYACIVAIYMAKRLFLNLIAKYFLNKMAKTVKRL